MKVTTKLFTTATLPLFLASIQSLSAMIDPRTPAEDGTSQSRVITKIQNTKGTVDKTIGKALDIADAMGKDTSKIKPIIITVEEGSDTAINTVDKVSKDVKSDKSLPDKIASVEKDVLDGASGLSKVIMTATKTDEKTQEKVQQVMTVIGGTVSDVKDAATDISKTLGDKTKTTVQKGGDIASTIVKDATDVTVKILDGQGKTKASSTVSTVSTVVTKTMGEVTPLLEETHDYATPGCSAGCLKFLNFLRKARKVAVVIAEDASEIATKVAPNSPTAKVLGQISTVSKTADPIIDVAVDTVDKEIATNKNNKKTTSTTVSTTKDTKKQSLFGKKTTKEKVTIKTRTDEDKGNKRGKDKKGK